MGQASGRARGGRVGEAERPALRQAQRGRILDAARRIVMRDGLAALSMRKIADAIGYSPASLYLYFENRDEIARALGDEGYAQLLEALEPAAQVVDPAARLRALAQAYVAFGQAQPETYRLVFVDVPTLPQRADMPGPDAEPVVRVFAGALAALGRTDDAPHAAALWATLHGIVMLALTRAGFGGPSLEPVVEAALKAWLGTSAAGRKRAAKPTRAAST
jgi:AcrR family transcriptional regulator